MKVLSNLLLPTALLDTMTDHSPASGYASAYDREEPSSLLGLTRITFQNRRLFKIKAHSLILAYPFTHHLRLSRHSYGSSSPSSALSNVCGISARNNDFLNTSSELDGKVFFGSITCARLHVSVRKDLISIGYGRRCNKRATI